MSSSCLSLGLAEFAFQCGDDPLHLPESLLLGQILHTGLQISVQTVQEELLQKDTWTDEKTRKNKHKITSDALKLFFLLKPTLKF